MASTQPPSETPFTLQNLPYGVITSKGNPTKRCATVLGDYTVDLSVLHAEGLFSGLPGLEENLFLSDHLNRFAALPRAVRKDAREKLMQHLSNASTASAAFIALSEIENHFPMDTRNFSDFYCSLEHTQNCTAVFRDDGVINPNWFTAPMVYNGRTSSLVISGTPLHRPYGIFPVSSSDTAEKEGPSFQPETQMDFELEMGVFLSEPLPRGDRLKIEDCKENIFGFVLLNDWSARNIQLFEMPPLGPFHAKGSATSISPWIVTTEALEAASCPRHSPQEAQPFAHLSTPNNAHATYDIELSLKILRDGVSYTLTESNLNELYWTPFQQLTHLASAGEGISTGDIFGTGTISSSRTNTQGEKIGLGCLFERKVPRNRLSATPEDLIETFLKDGDRVIIEGWCRDPATKQRLFGFGTCEGELMPAKEP
ncbi:fumarylacetoacetate hydrolase [Thozetella sp. PMI_491]|nr:fumarylacetoacetate hydrolase [Thozetella sp. PMI_491]